MRRKANYFKPPIIDGALFLCFSELTGSCYPILISAHSYSNIDSVKNAALSNNWFSEDENYYALE